MGTRAAGECLHSFFEFSQSFMSGLYNSIETRSTCFFISFRKHLDEKKEKNLLTDYQNVNSLCLRHHYVNSTRQFCVSIELYKHVFNQSARVLA